MPNRHFNRHHIIHERSKWESSQNGRELRNYEGLIIPMRRIGHEALHADCMPVPLLTEAIHSAMLDELDGRVNSGTSTVDMIGILAGHAIGLYNDLEQPTKVRRESGLFAASLIAQVPYIQQYAGVPLMA